MDLFLMIFIPMDIVFSSIVWLDFLLFTCLEFSVDFCWIVE